MRIASPVALVFPRTWSNVFSGSNAIAAWEERGGVPRFEDAVDRVVGLVDVLVLRAPTAGLTVVR